MREDIVKTQNIMIFDPDRNTASVTKLALQQAAIHYERHCRELDDAIEVHRATPANIILVDLADESEKEALEFINAIRAIPKKECPPPKIVGLLGQGTEDALRTCISIGADSVWVKPLSPSAIRKQLEHVIKTDVPYYEAEEYYGPDRRRVPDEKEYDGEEKRSG